MHSRKMSIPTVRVTQEDAYASCSEGNSGENPRPATAGKLQIADPNVAVADWMVVVLQSERLFVRTGLGRGTDVMAGGTGEFDVVLHQNAVVNHGDVGGACQFS